LDEIEITARSTHSQQKYSNICSDLLMNYNQNIEFADLKNEIRVGVRQGAWILFLAALPTVLVLTIAGCRDGEMKAIDRLSNGPAERQMREKVLALMPVNQSKLLDSFRLTCAAYDGQPNDIKKSEVFRGASSIYRDIG
jgi:hypothetical protein